ncbi:MAG: redoxin family protein [Aquihabitans sp.]
MTPPAPNSPSRSGRSSTIWLIGLAVVLLAGLVAVLATRDSNDKGDDSTAQSSTTAPDCTIDGPLPEFKDSNNDAAVCRTIPTAKGTSLEGQPMTIGAADGKAKVIIFVAHWCPHCQREVPMIVDHLKDTPMPSDVELLTVSTAVKPEAGNYPPKAWLDNAGWTAPVLDDTDGSAAIAYGLTSFPYFVVVDADGKVVVRGSGELSMDQFDQMVAAAQTGKSPV